MRPQEHKQFLHCRAMSHGTLNAIKILFFAFLSFKKNPNLGNCCWLGVGTSGISKNKSAKYPSTDRLSCSVCYQNGSKSKMANASKFMFCFWNWIGEI